MEGTRPICLLSLATSIQIAVMKPKGILQPRRLLIITIFTLFAYPVPSFSQFDELASLTTQKMAEYQIPGVALGVMKNGQMMTRGFGVTNIEDPQPVTTDTLFALASISKTVTATALVRLAEQGKVDLKAPVRAYLPDFRVADESASRRVTILNLLTHTPGWEGQLTVPDHGTDTLLDFVSSMKDLPQLAQPGEVWSYNNSGMSVAGRIIEVVSSKGFAAALRDLVFDPMRLSNATAVLGDVVTHRFAVGHQVRNGKAEVFRPYLLSLNPPAGGVAMSVNDLLAYARVHLTDPKLAAMRVPQLHKNATDDDMGIGWQLRNVGGVQTAAHGGTAAASLNLLLELVPERNLAFAILTNSSNGWRLIQDVERQALKSYEGLSILPNATLGHRGVDESMVHTTPMSKQPNPDEFVGTYSHPPLNSIVVRASDDGRLIVGTGPIVFYAMDRAYQMDGSAPGQPVEFIRDPGGKVTWIRVNGRIARKE